MAVCLATVVVLLPVPNRWRDPSQGWPWTQAGQVLIGAEARTECPLVHSAWNGGVQGTSLWLRFVGKWWFMPRV